MDECWVWEKLPGSLVTPFFVVVFYVNKFFNFYEDAEEKIYYGECLSIVQSSNRILVTLYLFCPDCILEKEKKKKANQVLMKGWKIR